MSDFRMQIIHNQDGRVMAWAPGTHVEVDLVEALARRLQLRGVGIFKTEEQVLTAVREEFAALLYELKALVRP